MPLEPEIPERRLGWRKTGWFAGVAAAAGFVLIALAGSDVARRHIGPQPPPKDISKEQKRCEDARKAAPVTQQDEARFVECDRPRPPGVEAFALGEPIFIPHGPAAMDAQTYGPGNCAHNGGSIADGTLFYEPDHVDVAIACSRARCQAKDAVGCRDLGVLHWLDVFPGVKKDDKEAMAAYERGCQLGDANSCRMLAHFFDERGLTARALELHTIACLAPLPEIGSCHAVGDDLLRQGKEHEAKPFLLRACRGTTGVAEPYRERREGCGLLAEIAAKLGDVASKWEYLRLECGSGGGREHACERVGMMLLREGNEERALPYLRAACGILPIQKGDAQQACREAERLSRKLEWGWGNN